TSTRAAICGLANRYRLPFGAMRSVSSPTISPIHERNASGVSHSLSQYSFSTLKYGGSVITASTFGSVGRISRQSPRYIVALPISTFIFSPKVNAVFRSERIRNLDHVRTLLFRQLPAGSAEDHVPAIDSGDHLLTLPIRCDQHMAPG